MATYHLRAKIISRGKGQSAVAAAAYRAGVSLRDERDGDVKDFTAREKDVVFSGIFAPKGAPEWMRDREQLWNRVEQIEKRKDAQLAREIELSLPHELTDEQREWLVKDFVREQFVRRGLVVDASIHAPGRESDARNHHAHLLITNRTAGPEGFAPTKDRSLNDRSQLETWREEWANLANRHLERHGHEARIDHRSHEDRGLEIEPSIYEGPAVTALARRGEITDRRLENEEIRLRNGERQRDAGGMVVPTDHWTDRAGMVAQQDEAMERTQMARAAREMRRDEFLTERAAAYYRQHVEPARDLGRDERAQEPRAEITDRKAEVTDSKAATSDLDSERAAFLARRAEQREQLGRGRDREEGGRER